MENKVILSIIIPVYNVESYVERCLESVHAQMMEGVEVIVVDDGSTDTSYEKCIPYSSVFSLFHKENGGLSDARNYGIKHAHGKYLMFLDSDDSLVPGSLEKVVAVLEANCDVEVFAAYPEELPVRKITDLRNGVYTGIDYVKLASRAGIFYVCAPFYIVSAEFLEENNLRFKQGILHEDSLWTPILLARAQKVCKTSIVFYSRFVREGSITHSKDNLSRRAVSMRIISRELRTAAKSTPIGRRMLNAKAVSIYLDSLVLVSQCDEKRFSEFSLLQLLQYPKGLRLRGKTFLFLCSPRLLIKIVNGMRYGKMV